MTDSFDLLKKNTEKLSFLLNVGTKPGTGYRVNLVKVSTTMLS